LFRNTASILRFEWARPQISFVGNRWKTALRGNLCRWLGYKVIEVVVWAVGTMQGARVRDEDEKTEE